MSTQNAPHQADDSAAMLMSRRIAIVGTSGSGKSTLAAALSHQMNCPHIDLDELHWQPNWQSAPQQEFIAAVGAAIAGESWALAGNYSSVRAIVIARADTLVWLDYGLSVIMWRHLRCAWRRVVYRESCCNGNYETLRLTLSRDAAWWYALKTFRRRKREYSALLRSPQTAHLKKLHFRSPRQTERWLRRVSIAIKVL